MIKNYKNIDSNSKRKSCASLSLLPLVFVCFWAINLLSTFFFYDVKLASAKEEQNKEKEVFSSFSGSASDNGERREDLTQRAVLSLTSADFHSTITKAPLIFVKFYTPWCGHCKALAPKFEEALRLIKNKASKEGEEKEEKEERTSTDSVTDVAFAEVNCDEFKSLCAEHGIKGYPSLKLFRNGGVSIEEYTGEREAKAIAEFVDKRRRERIPPYVISREIKSAKELKALIGVENFFAQRDLKSVPLKGENHSISGYTLPYPKKFAVLVGFFSRKDGVDFKYYSAVARQVSCASVDSYYVTDPSILESFGFFGGGSNVQLYRPDILSAFPPGNKFKNGRDHKKLDSKNLVIKVKYRGTIFKHQLLDWVLNNTLVNGVENNGDNEKLFKIHGRPFVRFILSLPSMSLSPVGGAPIKSVGVQDDNYLSYVPSELIQTLSKKYTSVLFAFANGTVGEKEEEEEGGRNDKEMKDVENFCGVDLTNVQTRKAYAKTGLICVVATEGATIVDGVKMFSKVQRSFGKLFPSINSFSSPVSPLGENDANGGGDRKNRLEEDKKEESEVEENVKSLEKFITDFVNKRLKVQRKTQPAPLASPTPGEVVKIVGTSFESVVMNGKGDADKNVFIKFYAPWCGHCKALAPKWRELAAELSDKFNDLLIADIDMTANELPIGTVLIDKEEMEKQEKGVKRKKGKEADEEEEEEEQEEEEVDQKKKSKENKTAEMVEKEIDYSSLFPYKGFPTLFFIPKGDKSHPIEYNGEREVNAMKRWVLEKIK